MKTVAKKDIYQSVTDQIVGAIEEGAGSYKLPWRTSGGFAHSPINAVSKKAYRGINVVVLWAAAQRRGYKSGLWATFKQWQEIGAQVRKGERSTGAVFWKFFEPGKNAEEQDAGDAQSSRRIPMVRDYALFNAEQVDGYEMRTKPRLSRIERVEEAEEFFRRLGVIAKAGANRACYCPKADSVFMPSFEQFKEALFYYSVLSHETTHWTGAPHRLNRDLSARFGSISYAMEELVAELGAAFLCAELDLPSDPRTDHAPYIATWLNAFKNDKKALFTAASKAQEAVDWMLKQAGTAEVGNQANQGAGLLASYQEIP